MLAKHLSKMLGTISNAHLKHSGDLLSRINDIPIKNKKLASLDVTSLFTCVPTEKVLKLLREQINNDFHSLPLPPDDFLNLVEMCLRLNYFKFNNVFYRQKLDSQWDRLSVQS